MIRATRHLALLTAAAGLLLTLAPVRASGGLQSPVQAQREGQPSPAKKKRPPIALTSGIRDAAPPRGCTHEPVEQLGATGGPDDIHSRLSRFDGPSWAHTVGSNDLIARAAFGELQPTRGAAADPLRRQWETVIRAQAPPTDANFNS